MGWQRAQGRLHPGASPAAPGRPGASGKVLCSGAARQAGARSAAARARQPGVR